MNCAFTICAKNYLAQALTLRESFLKHNPSLNFFIFLADKIDGVEDVDGVVALDKSWIPDWVNMAFKYDVIEFNYCGKKSNDIINNLSNSNKIDKLIDLIGEDVIEYK